MVLDRGCADERMQSLPLKRGRRPRSSPPTPNRDQLITAVLQILERQGERDLSMRGLAAILGVSAKLLYNHIRNKDELFDLAAEAMLQQWDLPHESLPWQARLTVLTQTGRKLVLRFPGLARRPLLRSVQAQYSPAAARVIDALKCCLADAGLTSAQTGQILIAYEAMLLGELIVCERVAQTDLAGSGMSISRSDIDAGFEAALSFMIKGIEASMPKRRSRSISNAPRPATSHPPTSQYHEDI